jgi:hypothetical protein
MADFAAPEPPVPQPPDASDVQEFQGLYNQDGAPPIEAPHDGSFQGMLTQMIGGALPGSASGNIFQAAIGRMAEMHQNSCMKMETLIDRISESSSLSPEEVIEAQLTLSDATTGLATYQSFDKKMDEGIKALMTGQ